MPALPTLASDVAPHATMEHMQATDDVLLVDDGGRLGWRSLELALLRMLVAEQRPGQRTPC